MLVAVVPKRRRYPDLSLYSLELSRRVEFDLYFFLAPSLSLELLDPGEVWSELGGKASECT